MLFTPQATLTAEIRSSLANFTQKLKAEAQATLTGEFDYGGHRVFSITNMACTLTLAASGPSGVTCGGGTLQVGANGFAPTLNIETSVLQYHRGSPGYVNGTVRATASTWTAYARTRTTH